MRNGCFVLNLENQSIFERENGFGKYTGVTGGRVYLEFDTDGAVSCYCFLVCIDVDLNERGG